MKPRFGFALALGWAMLLKEFIQLRRERLTFGMIIGIPVVQLALFGFAINNDPKRMPTAILYGDTSEFTRSFVAALQTSEYFQILPDLPDEEAGRAALARGEAMFVVNIPAGFTRRLLRGERPALLVEADATDPTATNLALGAMQALVSSTLRANLPGALEALAARPDAFEVRVHRCYNPEGITRYNIVPGLMGVILTLMMVMLTGLAMTRERERGTMENLLAMPARPLEVMLGKLLPYIAIGLIQCTIILLAARFVFGVPFVGGLGALYLTALLFVAANLTVGLTLSSLAKSQMQAMQMTMFYFLPNLMLSGFMFPFHGMPAWARAVGNVLPLTYFNRLVRAIFLKGSAWADLWPNLWPLLVFTVLVMAIAVKFYRKTLD